MINFAYLVNNFPLDRLRDKKGTRDNGMIAGIITCSIEVKNDISEQTSLLNLSPVAAQCARLRLQHASFHSSPDKHIVCLLLQVKLVESMPRTAFCRALYAIPLHTLAPSTL